MTNKWKDYVAMARPSHWMKHIFIIPGIILAWVLVEKPMASFPLSLVWGFLSACCIASANYVLNEWCDAAYDRYHPIKKHRPAAEGRVQAKFVFGEYVGLMIIGLFLASHISFPFWITSVIFLIVGVIYNVWPIRLKDCAICDVLVESLNNPLRLMLGWSMVSHNTIAPSSLFILYWFGGAFLMVTKRLAEYRYIAGKHDMDALVKYRRSFKGYTENSLLVSAFLYAVLSSFFISAFLIKYRNEFLFVFPVFAVLFAYYLELALRDASIAQMPEKLHKDKGLVFIVTTMAALLILFSIVDVPYAKKLVGKQEGINYKIWYNDE